MEKIKLEAVSEKYFGISSRRYRQLADESFVPQPDKGSINFMEAAKDLISYYRQLSEGSSDLNEARKQKIEIETELKKLQLLVEKKQLISRDEILQGFLDRIQAVKSGLLQLDRRLPGKLAGKEERQMGDIIRQEVNNLLDLYSKPPSGILKRIMEGGQPPRL